MSAGFAGRFKSTADRQHDAQVVAYDFGIKHNILRRLTSAGCKVTVVPAAWPAEKVLDMKPDGIFLSNGPVSTEPAARHKHMCAPLSW